MASWSSRPGVILGALTALNGLNYLDRYVAAATLPLILTGLGISDAQGGLLQSLFIVSYSLVCPLAGWVGDRQPRLRLAAIGVFVWSVATVASGLAPTYAWLLLARAVIGAGEASYAVVTPSLLSDCYAAAQRARVLGIFYAAIPVGSALGYIVGGVVGEAYGWRAAFFISGAPGAVLAFVLLFLTEPRRGAMEPPGAAAPAVVGVRASLRELGRRRSYLVNTSAQIIYTFAMGGLATWMPTYFVRSRGIPLATASATFGLLLVVAGFAGRLLGGRIAGRVAQRRPDPVHAAGRAGAAALDLLARDVRDPAPAFRQHRAPQRRHGQRAAGRAEGARLRRHDDADPLAGGRRLPVADRRGVGSDRARDPGAGDRLPAGGGGGRPAQRAAHAGRRPTAIADPSARGSGRAPSRGCQSTS